MPAFRVDNQECVESSLCTRSSPTDPFVHAIDTIQAGLQTLKPRIAQRHDIDGAHTFSEMGLIPKYCR